MKYHNNQQVAIFDKENTLQDLLSKGAANRHGSKETDKVLANTKGKKAGEN